MSISKFYQNILIIGLLIFGFTYSYCQTWKINSIRRTLTSINRISSSTLLIFGGDIAYKSTDNGESWSLPIKQSPQVGGLCLLNSYYLPKSRSAIFFVDSITGWACQYNNIMLKTTNGGNNWITLNTGINNISLQTVYFVNNHNWVCRWVGKLLDAEL